MKKKPNLNLKPCQKPEDWRAGLEAFRVRHDLRWSELERIFDGRISRRSLARMVKDGLSIPNLEARNIRALMRHHIRVFLEHRNQAPEQIDLELQSIFFEEKESMLTTRATLPKEAQKFFGLRCDPFPNEPPRSPKEAFTTQQLDRIAGQLEDAINYQGFVAVIGDRGSGKSFMKRRLVDTCNRSGGKMQILWPEFASMDKVHAGAICTHVLHAYNQKAARDLTERYTKLKKFLAGLSEEGIRIALGFDECHRLDARLLTALKNFWEIGSGGYDRYLGLVLFGQPRFENTLRDFEFIEITERLDVIHMPNMRKYAWDYVAHRVKLAGGVAEKLFDRDVVTKLAEIASTPLALGNLANTVLTTAWKQSDRRVVKGHLDAAGLNGTEPQLRASRKTNAA